VTRLSNTSATSDTISHSDSTVPPRVTAHTAAAAAALSSVTNGPTPVLTISEKSAPWLSTGRLSWKCVTSSSTPKNAKAAPEKVSVDIVRRWSASGAPPGKRLCTPANSSANSGGPRCHHIHRWIVVWSPPIRRVGPTMPGADSSCASRISAVHSAPAASTSVDGRPPWR
jgi:hypothetical protein